ncbi:MAG: xanthine dehydrogenase family protein subunit M [Pseudomonadota bacterium]
MQFHTPDTFEEASRLLAAETGTARVLAGGTDVLVQLRSDIVVPDTLVDIKRIEGVKEIVGENGGWRIGAAVSGAELSEHRQVKAEWPGIVEALDLVGSTQIQGRCTLTGNLCNASPAADSVPAMIAAGATVSITGPNGTREAKVEDIPVSPGKTSLSPGEIVSSVFLPARGANGGDAYLRFIPRTEMDIAVVGASVSMNVEGGKVASARVALGAVAPTALLVEDAAAAIIGTSLDDDAMAKLAAAASAACNPISDKRGTIEFRTRVAGVLARRAAKIAYERATS